MPYAANNQISTSPVEGGIEITDEQYSQALAGMQQGKAVTIDGGFAVIDPPEPEAPPDPDPVPPGYPQFSALEMLDLFTEDEQLVVAQAAMVNAAVKLWYDRNLAADYVTYEDPRVEEGLQALQGVGYLTPARKAEIVAAMQPAVEAA